MYSRYGIRNCTILLFDKVFEKEKKNVHKFQSGSGSGFSTFNLVGGILGPACYSVPKQPRCKVQVQNWLSSKCLTSVIIQKLDVPSWHQQLIMGFDYSIPSFLQKILLSYWELADLKMLDLSDRILTLNSQSLFFPGTSPCSRTHSSATSTGRETPGSSTLWSPPASTSFSPSSSSCSSTPWSTSGSGEGRTHQQLHDRIFEYQVSFFPCRMEASYPCHMFDLEMWLRKISLQY